MKFIFNFILVVLVLAAPWYCASATDAPGFNILKVMSAEDYRTTGLDHLSDAQIKALNAWFTKYQREHGGNCKVPEVAKAPTSGTVTKAANLPDKIVSHLEGTFTGWSGGTQFKLENGQTWVQIDQSFLSIAAIPHPRVTISKGLFNTYYLSIKGVLNTVPVRLIHP